MKRKWEEYIRKCRKCTQNCRVGSTNVILREEEKGLTLLTLPFLKKGQGGNIKTPAERFQEMVPQNFLLSCPNNFKSQIATVSDSVADVVMSSM